MSIVLEAYHEGDKAALEASRSQILHQDKLAAIGLLASGMAHEIGNPLASIQAICENQLRKPIDPQIAEKLQRITGQVGRIVNIVRQLVNFARRDPDKWKPVAINDEIHDELSVLSRRAKLIYRAITLGTISALLICFVIVSLFISAYVTLPISAVIAVLFVAGVIALIVALVLFLREVFLATRILRIGPP